MNKEATSGTSPPSIATTRGKTSIPGRNEAQSGSTSQKVSSNSSSAVNRPVSARRERNDGATAAVGSTSSPTLAPSPPPVISKAPGAPVASVGSSGRRSNISPSAPASSPRAVPRRTQAVREVSGTSGSSEQKEPRSPPRRTKGCQDEKDISVAQASTGATAIGFESGVVASSLSTALGSGSPTETEEPLIPSFVPPPGLGMPDLFANSGPRRELLEATYYFETDSYDEEVELLRCEAELVEAAAEIGTTTSADEDLLTTDADFDDDEDGLSSLPPLPSLRPFRPLKRLSVSSVVIEEDEEDMSSGLEGSGYEVDSSEIRSRLWAQSLLRLKRSIDEIYLLCEFESDESLCEQVRAILETASKDFDSLLKQLESQQEYALLGGEYPFKTGVAWTTRTPRTGRPGEGIFEQLEKAQLGSPSHCTVVPTGRSSSSGNKDRTTYSATSRPSTSRRPHSVEPRDRTAWLDESSFEADSLTARGLDASVGGGTGEAVIDADERYDAEFSDRGTMPSSLVDARSNQLEAMVQSALDRVNSRLGKSQQRPSPEELLKRHEARQRRAQQLRALQDDLRMSQLRQAESRLLAARERRQEREQRRQRELLEKMTRARRQYQEQLRIICQRAQKENRKTAEVAFIAKEALKSEKEILRQKQENAHLSRKLMREQMRQKLIDSANRVARVSENRRRQLEMWQAKVQQEVEEKERLASQRRREHMNSIKLKSQGQETRSEIVRGKLRVLQEVDERRAQDFLRIRSKTIGRLALDTDGLPEAIREEVSEALPVRRSSVGSVGKLQRKVSRPTTPPPKDSPTPQGSPHGGDALNEPWERTDGDEVSVPQPLPEVPLLPCSTSWDSSNMFQESEVGAESPNTGTNNSTKTKPCAGMPVPVANPKLTDSSSKQEDSIACTMSSTALTIEDVEEAVTAAGCLERLRAQLQASALSDEDALRIACEGEGSKANAANAAQRARISKLAIDLSKVAGTLGGGSGNGSTDDLQQPASILNLERTEAVLGDFCKILGQSQREADFALVLKLNCARLVVDICTRVKDSIAGLSALGAKVPPASWRQNSNVMLSALKWLGLLCKQRLGRIFFLLTSRVVTLADVATACLDMHFADALKPQDAQGGPVLFLPQLLHVLSLHTKSATPEVSVEQQATLSAHLLLCGLGEKLRELFRRAEIRGLKLFDGASLVPLLLLRAMGFLGNLVSSYRLPALATHEALEVHAHILEIFRRTELFGIVGILVSILLSEGRRDKAAKLPQTVVSLSVQAVRILNGVARVDLKTLQQTLGAGHHQQELYHLLVSLLDYCAARLPAIKPNQGSQSTQAEEDDLLHETVVLLGYYCLQQPENQSIMCYGEGQPLLARLTSLPLYYFMDERGRSILFPTILATCFKSEQNLEILRSEMNLSLLRTFLSSHLTQREEANSSVPAFSSRFPVALWQDALTFLSDNSSYPSNDTDRIVPET